MQCNTPKYILLVFNMFRVFVSIIEFFVNLIRKYGKLETRKFYTIKGQNRKLSKKVSKTWVNMIRGQSINNKNCNVINGSWRTKS